MGRSFKYDFELAIIFPSGIWFLCAQNVYFDIQIDIAKLLCETVAQATAHAIHCATIDVHVSIEMLPYENKPGWILISHANNNSD